MDFFLKIKHWKLLLIIALPPIVIEIFSGESLTFWNMVGSFYALVIWQTWLFCIGLFFKNPFKASIQVSIFKLCYIYNILYLLLSLIEVSSVDDPYPYWQLPFHVLSFFSLFFLIYFSAKNFVLFEKTHYKKTHDFFTTFILLWFFPIGIFFIQTRINEYWNISKKGVQTTWSQHKSTASQFVAFDPKTSFYKIDLYYGSTTIIR